KCSNELHPLVHHGRLLPRHAAVSSIARNVSRMSSVRFVTYVPGLDRRFPLTTLAALPLTKREFAEDPPRKVAHRRNDARSCAGRLSRCPRVHPRDQARMWGPKISGVERYL